MSSTSDPAVVGADNDTPSKRPGSKDKTPSSKHPSNSGDNTIESGPEEGSHLEVDGNEADHQESIHPVESSSQIHDKALTQPPLPTHSRPWLTYPSWQRQQHELMFCKATVPGHGAQWKYIELFQESQDLEMVRYLEDFPLDQWMIPREQADHAYQGLAERYRKRSLGFTVYGPDANGYTHAGDKLSVIDSVPFLHWTTEERKLRERAYCSVALPADGLFQQNMDYEMQRYMIYFPLEQWIVPQETAQRAHDRMSDRCHLWRFGLPNPDVVSSLTNEIHPLFERTQFAQLSDERYALIRPALRAVSLFLQTDDVVKFAMVLKDGELRRDTQPHGAGVKTSSVELAQMKDAHGNAVVPNISRHPTAAMETVDEAMRSHVAKALLEAKDRISFGFKVLGHEIWAVHDGPDLDGKSGMRIPGNSKISVDVSVLAQIEELHQLRKQKGQNDGLDRKLLNCLFMLACTLLHELFHALEYGWSGHHYGHCETFYEDCPLAECGFAVEAALFGGIPEVPESSKSISESSHLILENWPSQNHAERYDGIHKLGRRALLEPLTNSSSEIPPEDVKAVFTMESWEEHSFRVLPGFMHPGKIGIEEMRKKLEKQEKRRQAQERMKRTREGRDDEQDSDAKRAKLL